MLKRAVIFVVALLLLAFIIGKLVGFENVWARVAGPPDLGSVDFRGLEKGPRPNQALVCPAGLCNPASVDLDSPVYALDARRLAELAQSVLEAMADSERVDDGARPTARRFVVRSQLMRFPDTVVLEAIEGATPGTARIAIYSRSQVGYRDMGANLDRVRALLDGLTEHQAR